MNTKEQFDRMDKLLFNENFNLSHRKRLLIMTHVFAEDSRIEIEAYSKMLHKIYRAHKPIT
jgi:hypothetical protein